MTALPPWIRFVPNYPIVNDDGTRIFSVPGLNEVRVLGSNGLSVAYVTVPPILGSSTSYFGHELKKLLRTPELASLAPPFYCDKSTKLGLFETNEIDLVVYSPLSINNNRKMQYNTRVRILPKAKGELERKKTKDQAKIEPAANVANRYLPGPVHPPKQRTYEYLVRKMERVKAELATFCRFQDCGEKGMMDCWFSCGIIFCAKHCVDKNAIEYHKANCTKAPASLAMTPK
jgi:hypothetical protein